MTDALNNAKVGHEMQAVCSPFDLMVAATWGNPRLARFVAEHQDYANSALHLLSKAIDDSGASASVRRTHELTRDRIIAAMEASPQTEQSVTHVLTPGELHAMAERLCTYAQGILDQYDARKYWSPERHVELESELYKQLIEPLISGGAIKGGHINVGLGTHPATGSHHSLIVGRVKLESA